MILKYNYRKHNQTRAIYFSGWEDEKEEYKVNRPETCWLACAKSLSKTKATKCALSFETFCREKYGPGQLSILKDNRAYRAGWRG